MKSYCTKRTPEGYRSFGDARALVRGLALWRPYHKIIMRHLKFPEGRWQEWCKQNAELVELLLLPTNPHQVYENDGWIDYDNFIGPEVVWSVDERGTPIERGAPMNHIEVNSKATQATRTETETDAIAQETHTPTHTLTETETQTETETDTHTETETETATHTQTHTHTHTQDEETEEEEAQGITNNGMHTWARSEVEKGGKARKGLCRHCPSSIPGVIKVPRETFSFCVTCSKNGGVDYHYNSMFWICSKPECIDYHINTFNNKRQKSEQRGKEIRRHVVDADRV